MPDAAAEGSVATPVPQPMNKSISIDTPSVQIMASKNYANTRDPLGDHSRQSP